VPTAEGDVIIHPINHATFVMEWGSRMIYVDPVGGSSRFTGLPRADLILVTHDHSDHYDNTTLTAVKQTNTVIVAPAAVVQKLTTALKPLAVTLTNGAGLDTLDCRVDAVPAYNLTVSNHPKGVGNGYVLTLGGKRIYISGDTEDTPELRALEAIDIAFVCMNLPYTMSVTKAASAVRQFRPRVVYPYHYSGGSDVNQFKRLVGMDLGIEVRLRKWY
jgi:L-ascorbate metabolism protein UlaG (beta-lactamase superfamily)